MKKFIITSIFAFFLAGGSALMAQASQAEYLGLPGDNLNLYAVMETFRESETLEAFERAINDPEYMVNNLDLNGDGYVDYIMVNDYVEGNIHYIVLRVALNASEYQDVAVFVVEKLRDGSVTVQLIGDETLYGANYIIEPHYAETTNPGYRGNVTRPANNVVHTSNVVHTTYYEVASWPVIVYISRPVYRPWRSVWYYGYYPSYWSPWRAHYWHYYYGYHYHWQSHYYSYYRPWRTYRGGFYTNYYVASVRRYSPVVVVNINRGVYKPTYSRPDTRKQGEALYAQRGSSSGRVPAGTGRSEATGRTNSGQVSRDANTAGTQSVNAPRNATSGASTRSEAVTRTQQENVRKEATPAVDRNAPRSSGQSAAPARTAPASNNRSSAAPASAPSRPAAAQSPAQARTAPASNDRSSSAPANVNRSQPAPSRESAPRVSAPAQNNRSSAPAPAVSRSSSNTHSSAPDTAVSSSNTRNSSPAPARTNNSDSRGSSSKESNTSTSRGR